MIREGLAGKTLFVTGSTGFLGKSIVEKCLRDLPEVARISLGIRSSARRSARERLDREVLASPAFRALKQDLGDADFAALVERKLQVVEIDLGRDGLGLDDAGRAALAAADVVIHSAAAVEFDNPADLSAQTNLLGAARLVGAVAGLPTRPHLVHISTAFVGGQLRGLVREEPALDPGLNWRHEAEVLAGLRPAVEEESRRPEVLHKLQKEARSRMGPAGTPAMARTVERLREKWVKDRLVERGRVHARALGFSDIYSFTKAMAEAAVIELHGDVPLSILRPSIIESALAEPFPGWLEGFRMAEPIILAFGRGVLPDFPGLPDSVVDVIPADYVVNAVLAVAASPPPDAAPRIYHACSGSRNPLRFRDLFDHCRDYFQAHPLRDRYGQAIGTPDWTFPTMGEVVLRGRVALRALEAAQWLVERLPLGADGAETSDRLLERRSRLSRGLDLAELYGVYTAVDAVFDSRHLQSLWEQLDDSEQATFPFDAATYSWDRYLDEVHLPTVVRMARADTVERRGRQPSGSTAPRAGGSSGAEAVRRVAGRPDVLAVFDVDGTLVETNVVEYYLWMRLRAQPVRDWPGFLGRMATETPRWLWLERRSRADFQRTFYRQYAGLEVEEMRRLGREALHEVTLRRIYPEGVRRIREHKRAGHRVLLLTGALNFVVEPLAEMLEVEVDCASLLERDGRLTGDLSVEARLDPCLLEVVEQILCLVLEPQDRDASPGGAVRKRHAVDALPDSDRMAVRAGLRIPDGGTHVGLEPWRHRVLEVLGLLVHVVPRNPDHVGQEALDHPVTADDVLGVAAAVLGEVDRASRVAHDVPVALEPAEHLMDRRSRQLHRPRQVRAGHRQARLEQPEKALEILLLGGRRAIDGHAMIVQPCLCP